MNRLSTTFLTSIGFAAVIIVTALVLAGCSSRPTINHSDRLTQAVGDQMRR